MPQTLKKLFLIFLLTELLFAYAPAFAQTPAPSSYYTGVSGEIEKYLCNPTSGGTGILYQCINQIYKFAIVTASIMGVFFIVIAGYVYMSAEGNKESVDKAKDILVSTITSLVILLAGYVLLNALNPDLIQFHGNTLQPVNFTSPPTTTTTTGTGGTTIGTAVSGGTISGSGAGTVGSGRCVPITDSSSPASVANLQNTCLSANATLFSEISNEETGGQSIPSGSDKCADGNSVSFGLFQINITGVSIGSLPCPSAFNKPYTATDHSCVVTNQTLYQQCKTAALDPNQNIQAACAMSNNGTSLAPWNGSCFAKWTSN
jgi:hypothetical protein